MEAVGQIKDIELKNENPPSIKIWKHKHILDLDDFTPAEIDLVMQTTDAMHEILSRPIKKVPTLRGKTVVTLFYEASTRTRSSFELAAKNKLRISKSQAADKIVAFALKFFVWHDVHT